MQQPRLTGPGAGVEKYDLLTALSVTALGEGGHAQVLLLRLSALLTARYNWAQDELSLGQKEMAAMWSVDERTVKREIRRLLDDSLLILLRPGVKGRVALYRLNQARLAARAQPFWERVGRDYAARMAERYGEVPVAEILPPVAPGPWARVLERLGREDAARAEAWFVPLRLISDTGETLVLQAPSRFAHQYIESHFMVQLRVAVQLEMGRSWRILLANPGV